jgi:hypothetical protein
MSMATTMLTRAIYVIISAFQVEHEHFKIRHRKKLR